MNNNFLKTFKVFGQCSTKVLKVSQFSHFLFFIIPNSNPARSYLRKKRTKKYRFKKYLFSVSFSLYFSYQRKLLQNTVFKCWNLFLCNSILWCLLKVFKKKLSPITNCVYMYFIYVYIYFLYVIHSYLIKFSIIFTYFLNKAGRLISFFHETNK